LFGKFLDEVHGNRYQFRPSQLLRRNSEMNNDSDTTGGSLVEKDRGFFCSELIVKALKTCKIMAPTEEASSNFLPGAFSS
jgi:hypothetical protein